MHSLKTLLLSLLAIAPVAAFGAFKLEVGKPLPELTISNPHGGNVKDGGAWNSKSMQGTVNFIVYVDPDDSELNNALVDRLKEEKFPAEQFRSIAIINLAATWKPNAIVMSVLRGKQEKFPNTTYVFDNDRYTAQNWNVAPEGYHVLLVDRDGTVLIEKAGKLDTKEIDSLVATVKDKLKAGTTLAKPSSPAPAATNETSTQKPL